MIVVPRDIRVVTGKLAALHESKKILQQIAMTTTLRDCRSDQTGSFAKRVAKACVGLNPTSLFMAE